MNIALDPQESFKIGLEYLKSRVEYIFNSPRMKPDTWRVAYWSVKVQRSSIIKFGTEGDIAGLPPESKRTRTRKQTTRTSSDGRQVKRRRIRKNAPSTIQPQIQDDEALNTVTTEEEAPTPVITQ